MINRVEGGWPVKAAASAAGVSVHTVYKWLARYRNEGRSGLIDRSSAPRVCPRFAGQPACSSSARRLAAVSAGRFQA
jgi:transposase-like protein